jgi:hypothetical protein
MSEPSVAVNGSAVEGLHKKDRRAKVRHASHHETSCHQMASQPSDTWWEGATVRDISATGIGLVLQRQVEPGAVLIVGFEDMTQLLAVRVVHVTPHDTGWFAGCKFTNKLSDAELKALL